MDKLQKHAYKLIVLLAVSTLATGTIVYHFTEKLTWLNSYYFSVITLSTVGYGDITPKTPFGKLFTTFYIFVGVGIITAFITSTMKRQRIRYEEKHSKEIKKLESES